METEKYDANEMLKQMAAEAVKQQAHVRAAVRDLERIPVTWKRSLHVGSNWCILAG